MKAQVNFDSLGGGDDGLYFDRITVNANTPLNLNITGTAKCVVCIDEESVVTTNVDPSTNEPSDTTAWVGTISDGTWAWAVSTGQYFICTNGNISTASKLRSYTKKTLIMWTLE